MHSHCFAIPKQVLQRLFLVVSDHGYGHMTRCLAILNSILSNYTNNSPLEVLILSVVPLSYIQQRCSNFPIYLWNDYHSTSTSHIRIFYLPQKLDTGCIESTHHLAAIDILSTISSSEKYLQHFDSLVRTCCASLLNWKPNLLFYDISIVGPCIAKQMNWNIPVIAFSNFTWDWMYQIWSKEDYPSIESIRNQFYECYSSTVTTHFLYPSVTDETVKHSFSTKVQCIPLNAFVCSNSTKQLLSTQQKSKNRNKLLELFPNCLQVEESSIQFLLISFGGAQGSTLLYQALLSIQHAIVVPANFRIILLSIAQPHLLTSHFLCTNFDSISSHLHCTDFVQFFSCMDIQIGKIGYGTMCDCLTFHIPLLYVSRKFFREEKELEKVMNPHQMACLQEESILMQWKSEEFFFKANACIALAKDRKYYTTTMNLNGAQLCSQYLIRLLEKNCDIKE